MRTIVCILELTILIRLKIIFPKIRGRSWHFRAFLFSLLCERSAGTHTRNEREGCSEMSAHRRESVPDSHEGDSRRTTYTRGTPVYRSIVGNNSRPRGRTHYDSSYHSSNPDPRAHSYDHHAAASNDQSTIANVQAAMPLYAPSNPGSLEHYSSNVSTNFGIRDNNSFQYQLEPNLQALAVGAESIVHGNTYLGQPSSNGGIDNRFHDYAFSNLDNAGGRASSADSMNVFHPAQAQQIYSSQQNTQPASSQREHSAIDLNGLCECRCGRKFGGELKNARANRKRHIDSFTNGKQHVCNYAPLGCNYTANRADNMATHVKRCRRQPEPTKQSHRWN